MDALSALEICVKRYPKMPAKIVWAIRLLPIDGILKPHISLVDYELQKESVALIGVSHGDVETTAETMVKAIVEMRADKARIAAAILGYNLAALDKPLP